MTIVEIISSAANLVTSVVACVGVAIAGRGLSTWRQQLKGQNEYELARRILVALYKYRDAIDSLRDPIINFVLPKELDLKADGNSFMLKTIEECFDRRLSMVKPLRSALQVDLIESEVLWGGRLKEIFNSVFSLENKLNAAIKNFLARGEMNFNQLSGLRGAKRNKEFNFIFSSSNMEDEFKADLTVAIELVEIYLKPKLHKK